MGWKNLNAEGSFRFVNLIIQSINLLNEIVCQPIKRNSIKILTNQSNFLPINLLTN